MAGRCFGKTRAGAEWVRGVAETTPEARIALVAASLGEARVVMVEGESGVLEVSTPRLTPQFEPSPKRLTWPNGAQAMLYSASEPESLRGPQHSVSPSCDWSGRAGQIASRQSRNWLFTPPQAGMRLLNKATGQDARFVTGWNTPVKPAAPTRWTIIDAEARTTIGAILAVLVAAGIVPAS